MKFAWCAGVVMGCAFASSGCSSAPSTKGDLGSYMVMITNTDVNRTDSDVMTVAGGSGGDLLLTFIAGITTDVAGPNPDGLRADVKSKSEISIAAQPAHVDHSTGNLDGTISGSGTFNTDGCDIKLSFVPAGGSTMSFEVTGTHL